MDNDPNQQNNQIPGQQPVSDPQPSVVVFSPDVPVAGTGQDVNAFNALAHDKLGNATADRLDSADVPKKLGEFNAIKGIIAGIVIIAVSIALTVYIDSKSHQSKDAIYIGVGGSLFGLLFIVFSVISFKQLHRSAVAPQQFNQFQTDTAVSYITNLPVATLAADETLQSWLGPMLLTGKEAVSYGIAAHENDKQAVNTLLFTNLQVIGIMFGPQDVPASLAGGTMNQALSAGVNYSAEDADAKTIQFEMLYLQKWGDIVAGVTANGLANLPAQHLTWGIPYGQIQNVEIKEGAMNPGLTLHFRDGSKRKFICMQKDLLPGVQQFLTSKVQVS